MKKINLSQFESDAKIAQAFLNGDGYLPDSWLENETLIDPNTTLTLISTLREAIREIKQISNCYPPSAHGPSLVTRSQEVLTKLQESGLDLNSLLNPQN